MGRVVILSPHLSPGNMDAFTKLKREKFLRETVVPEAVRIFDALRIDHVEADPYELARHAAMAALAKCSPTLHITSEHEGRAIAQSYMRMCEAEFAVEIQGVTP